MLTNENLEQIRQIVREEIENSHQAQDEAYREGLKARKMGEYIRRKRKEKDISLRKFAQEVGISATMMSKIEHGDFPILNEIGFKAGAETIKRIACILETNLDELLAMDSKVDPVLIDEIVARPCFLPFIIRELAGASDSELHEIIQFIKGLRNAD